MKICYFVAGVMALWGSFACGQDSTDETTIDEITVFGQGRPIKDTHYASPTSTLLPKDLVSINAMTTEDLVKFEPDLVIRRRFIGDPNGTLGMRGSNMFQTTRSMVFADGIPLHYLLQTQYNGSPRWSLVAADEIAVIDVIYGPYSAEYSGNSMGGVVNIETRIPTERQFHVEGSLFQQSFDHQGFDEAMDGGRGFISYGDRFGDLSVYAAYNHLQNSSQPMDYLFDSNASPIGSETAVTGSRQATDEYGNPVAYYGNTGSQQADTNQLKTKIGYEFADWLALLTVAYEQREVVRDSLDNYLRTDSGDLLWSGSVVDNGIAFDVNSSDFSVSDQERRSLLIGAQLQGKVSENWWMEASASDFTILEDESRNSLANPLDPAYTSAGSISAYDQTGWKTAEVKFQNDNPFGNDALSLVTGYGIEHYQLGMTSYASSDYASGVRTTESSASGGDTDIQALYAQIGWQLNETIDLGIGGRYEWWQSDNGYYYDYSRDNLQDHPDRSENDFSPKFTIGYIPGSEWQMRYSLAKAYRFPIVEELFQNERRTAGTSIANANLKPEDGIHQNLMLEHTIDGGYVRLNIFQEDISDVIFNQSTIIDNRLITTFLPIDEVSTFGTELIVNRSEIASKLDVRFNLAYVDSEITHNDANPSLEGNEFPRMPKWRANVLATYHVSEQWDFGGGIRYASNNFGDLDNSDTAKDVFGAQDAYTQISLKSSYVLNDNIRISAGIDNLTNAITFVHHPWPGRTLYLEAALNY